MWGCESQEGTLGYGVLSRLPRYEFDRAYVERLTAGDPETESHFTRYFGDLLSLEQHARALREQTSGGL